MVDRATKFLFCALALIILALGARLALGQERGDEENSPPATMALSRRVRDYYRNPDGSCVQCSNGMVGWHHANENQATLLWNTHYGPAVRGGSNPSRVASYCRSRGLRIYNVTGEQKCRAMMLWAAKTNRWAAIGFKSSHFCTFYGRRPAAPKPWGVCDNNIRTVDWYDDADFRSIHLRSGPWVVIPDGPAPASPPEPTAWWK
jgi:hypothetical protein